MVLVQKVVKYFLVRVNLDLEILEKQEFVTKIRYQYPCNRDVSQKLMCVASMLDS